MASDLWRKTIPGRPLNTAVTLSLLAAAACGDQASSDDLGRAPPGYPLVQCTLMVTDSPTDLALEGWGFLAVGGPGTARRYVRGGHYQLNGDGFLVDADYRRLQGYVPTSNGGAAGTGELQDLWIAPSTAEPRATTRVQIQAQLDSSAPVLADGGFDPARALVTSMLSTSVDVYDLRGIRHAVGVHYRREGPGQWTWHAVVDGGDVGGTPGTTAEVGAGRLLFDNNGWLAEGATGRAFFAFYPFGGEQITIAHGSVMPWSGEGTFGATTEGAHPGGIYAIAQDGYATARLTGFEIQPNGTVLAGFPGRDRTVVAHIPVFWFRDFSGLAKSGFDAFRETARSGPGVPMVPGTSRAAVLLGNTLEQSCDPPAASGP